MSVPGREQKKKDVRAKVGGKAYEGGLIFALQTPKPLVPWRWGSQSLELIE